MKREITFEIKKYEQFFNNQWIVWKIDNAASDREFLGRFDTEQLAEQFVMLKKLEQ
jgi:hypothetical protein